MADPDDDTSIKLVDFGIAAKVEGDSLDEFVGSLHYLAPEVLKSSKYGKSNISSIDFDVITPIPA